MVTRRHGAKCLIIVEKEDCFSGGLHLNKLSRFIFEEKSFCFCWGLMWQNWQDKKMDIFFMEY